MSIWGISHHQSYPPEVLSTETRRTCLLLPATQKSVHYTAKIKHIGETTTRKYLVLFCFRKDGFLGFFSNLFVN